MVQVKRAFAGSWIASAPSGPSGRPRRLGSGFRRGGRNGAAGQDHGFAQRLCHAQNYSVATRCGTIGPPMNPWYYFWMGCFAIAGSAFAIIAAIVMVRGIGDLRQMFTGLRSEQRR